MRHHDIRAHRVEDIGDYFLRAEEYRYWLNDIRGEESDNSALFCNEDLGLARPKLGNKSTFSMKQSCF